MGFFAGLDDTLSRLDAYDPYQFTERVSLIKVGGISREADCQRKDPQFRERSGSFEVTDQTDLPCSCDRVVITGSTLINDALDDVLSQFDPNAQGVLVGSSASCLPDPIFERGWQYHGL